MKLTPLRLLSPSTGKALAVLTAIKFAVVANAATLLYEGFDYTGSNLDSANGGSGWTTSWQSNSALSADSTANIGSGSLVAPTDSVAPTGNSISLTDPGGQVLAARGIAEPARIDLGSDSTFYFSFLAEKTTSGLYMNFRQGNSTNVLSLAVSSGGAVTMTLDDVATSSGTVIANNYSYLYVGKIVGSSTGAATAYFTRYVEAPLQSLPSLEPESWLLEATLPEASILFADRIVLSGGSNRTVSYDEIRIGSTWAEGVGVIPEPSAFAAISGILVLGLAFTRRPSRS
tara:strand:- start:12683 stop:13543 length:861 start_codon:yes stop_codon:yes gene_type:complete